MIGHRIRTYQVLSPPPNDGSTAWAFNPGDCGLVRRELSGPGVFAIGDSVLEARARLIEAEEMLHG